MEDLYWLLFRITIDRPLNCWCLPSMLCHPLNFIYVLLAHIKCIMKVHFTPPWTPSLHLRRMNIRFLHFFYVLQTHPHLSSCMYAIVLIAGGVMYIGHVIEISYMYMTHCPPTSTLAPINNWFSHTILSTVYLQYPWLSTSLFLYFLICGSELFTW